MTRTDSFSAPRAPRLVTAAVLALTAVFGPLAAVPAFASAAAADAPPWAPPLTFRAAPGGEGAIVAGRQLLVSMTASNPTFSTVAAGGVTVEVGDTALSSRDAVAAWVDDGEAGNEAGGTFTLIGTGEIDSIAARGTATATVPVDTSELEGWAPGIYPLRATYDSADGALVSTSVVVIADDDANGTVAVIVPITAPALDEGLLDADRLAELTADDGSLRSQLDAVTGTSAILAVDPAIAAAIRVLGSTAPASATEWLNDLLALPNDRFALQFGDADLQTQLSSGLSKPLTVTSLDAFIDPATLTAADPSPSPTPGDLEPDTAPSADDDADVLPDVASLTAIGAPTRPAVYWPADGTATPDAVAALGALVQEDTPSLTVLSSAAVTDESGAHARSDEADLLIYDDDASRALQRASAAESMVARAAALAEATAYGVLAADDEPLLVTVDRAADRDRAELHAAILTASHLGGRTAVDLGALVLAEATDVTVDGDDAEETWTDTLDALRADEADLGQFATILEDETLLTGPERAAVLQLIGNGWHQDDAAWSDAVAAHRSQTTETLNAVGIDPLDDVNLFGSSIPLAFSVRNDLAWPVSLVLITEPNDPLLKVQTRTPVDAGAQQSTRVDVPVEARVGSGDATLSLQLQSPAYIPIGDPMTVSVSVRADWETFGVVTMAVLVVGLLGVGAARTIIRVRRVKAAESKVDAGDDARG